MPENQTRRPWVKLWTREYIHGTTRKELDPAERSLWIDFMALAGDSPQIGNVCIAEDIGYTDDQLCRLLNVDNELLTRSIQKMIDAQKIKRNGTGVIEIINFWKYQPHFDRDAYQREYMAQKRKSNNPKTNKDKSNQLDKHVSLTPVSPNYKDKEEDIEIDKDYSLKKDITNNLDQSTTNKPINTPKGDEKSSKIQDKYKDYQKELLETKNPIAVLVKAFIETHSDAPACDKTGKVQFDRLGTISKRHNNDYGIVLRAIFKTIPDTVDGSHLNWIEKFLAPTNKVTKQAIVKPRDTISIAEKLKKETEAFNK